MRRLCLLTCALLSCFCLSTCGDPWLVGPGPSWLPLIEASFNVRASLGGASAGVAALERLELGGTEYVFVLASDGGPQLHLYALDAKTMSFRYSFEQPSPDFNQTLMRGLDGRVRCGSYLIDPAFTLSYSAGISTNARAVSDGVYNYVLIGNSTFIDARRYDSSWGADLSGNSYYDSLSGTYALLDADFFAADAATPARVLAGSNKSLWAGSHVGFGDLVDSFYALDYGERTGPVPAFKDGGWLTADGLIGGLGGDKDEGLARYAYGSGELLDSIPMRDMHSSAIFFDPDGEHWYIYDDWSGRLYMLRTWWKP